MVKEYLKKIEHYVVLLPMDGFSVPSKSPDERRSLFFSSSWHRKASTKRERERERRRERRSFSSSTYYTTFVASNSHFPKSEEGTNGTHVQKRGGGNGEEKREKKELSESIEFDIFFFCSFDFETGLPKSQKV